MMDGFLAADTVTIECMDTSLVMYRVTRRLMNADLDRLMNSGWCIITTWIDASYRDDKVDDTVHGVSLRIGKMDEATGVNMRLIATADVKLPMSARVDATMYKGVIRNIDADEPGTVVGITPTTSTELWKLRLVSIAGYGTCSSGGSGVRQCAKMPPLSVVGLDIEVTTYMRRGGMPLPHDPIISITISNGAWYDKTGDDICICIHTFGTVKSDLVVDGRKPTIVKAQSSPHAVVIAYMALERIGCDFVNVHNGFGFDLNVMAAHGALVEGFSHTFERRRLGNSGTGTFWSLPNGCLFVDSMYMTDKTDRKNWGSLSLAKMCAHYDLPPKLDSGGMTIKPGDDVDITEVIVYNCRDTDLHAWLARRLKLGERACVLAGISRSLTWDGIAHNTGLMAFCMIQSACISMGTILDLSASIGADERQFEGGFVFEPTPGCYRGVVVIDGNSLYASIMSKLGIFIDRCASSRTVMGLGEKMGVHLPEGVDGMMVGDVIDNDYAICMRNVDTYMGIVKGPPTVVSGVIKELLRLRKDSRSIGDTVMASCTKTMATSLYGFLASAYTALSSKTCAEIITYMARNYLRRMVAVTESCGYKVIYGDTDSIFPWVKGETEAECMQRGMSIKTQIDESMAGTVFREVEADIKGNYMSVVISSKKKYEGVLWDGTVDTKGLAPVKKDTLPIVRYVMTEVLSVLNSDDTKESKNERLIGFLSKVLIKLQSGKLPMKSQVIEVKIDCQPHIAYKRTDGTMHSVLIDLADEVRDVDKRWVAGRIRSAVDGILNAVGMVNVSEMLFSYESRRRARTGPTAACRTRSCTSTP